MLQRLLLLVAVFLVLLAGCRGGDSDGEESESVASAAVEATSPPTATEVEAVDPTSIAIDTVEPTASPTVTAAATVTHEPTVAATPTPTATEPPTPTPAPTIIPMEALVELLPGPEDVGTGYTVSREEASEDPMSLAATWPDPDAHIERLTQWGFKRWVLREVALPAPGLNDLAVRPVYVSCSIIEYGSPEQVIEATEYLWNYLLGQATDNRTVDQVSGETLGEWSILSVENDTTGQQQVIRSYVWAQTGSFQYSCRSGSGIYNPLDDAIRLTKQMLTGAFESV